MKNTVPDLIVAAFIILGMLGIMAYVFLAEWRANRAPSENRTIVSREPKPMPESTPARSTVVPRQIKPPERRRRSTNRELLP